MVHLTFSQGAIIIGIYFVAFGFLSVYAKNPRLVALSKRLRFYRLVAWIADMEPYRRVVGGPIAIVMGAMSILLGVFGGLQ
jgi:hypothetical protein